MPPRSFAQSDALSVVLASAALFVLLSILFSGLGGLGMALVQVLSFAAPALLLARAREGGLVTLGLGWGRCRPLALLATAGLAASLWVWNLHWIMPLGQQWASGEQSEALTQMFAVQERPLWITIALFALIPAICEELLHRGVLLPALHRTVGEPAALLLSALLFGLTHLNLSRLLPTATLGLVAGALRLRTGSLLAPMLLHFLYNASLLSAAQQGWLVPSSAALPAAAISLASAAGLAWATRDTSESNR